ncbi:MAG: DUF2478 domain-containing protein [Longimicrobiales bacterium]
MLLIALEGPVGSGKTTLLSTLAAWYQAEGRPVDGFLAIAGSRGEPGRGALRYDLRLVSSGRTLPFATRDPDASPPYRFDPDTADALLRWAEGLSADAPPDLLVLDEFGRVEAEGGGHLAIWPAVEASAPEVVAVAVRAGVREAVEGHLGRRFDVRIDASDPGAWDALRSACHAHRDWSRIGVWGAGSGTVEVTLGSALHGARVPFRGLVLSTVQAIMMAFAGDGLIRRARAVWVPFIAAGLKAISPAGSRLRPMLAISVQGMLFAGATTVLGWNGLGIAVGGGLVGAWAAAQGVLLQLLLIGSDLLLAYQSVIDWVTARWPLGEVGVAAVLGAWITGYGLIAAAATWAVWRRRKLPRRLERALDRGAHGFADRVGRSPRSWGTAAGSGLRDLARPVFWLPLVVVVAILLAVGSPWERAAWIVVRAATIGFLLFSAARALDIHRFVAWLRGRGHWGPALAFGRAVRGARTRSDETTPPSGTDAD